jgi:hypothetical protein
MLAQRSLLLIIFFLFFFEPGMANWLSIDAGHWHRPYLVWIAIIAIVYLAQRWNEKSEL